MKNISLIILIFLSARLQAQQINRYVIYFSDKEQNPYTLSAPEEFLSPRALERRNHQDILLTQDDLPVSPVYVEKLEEAGLKIFYRSRWFNAVLAEASTEQITSISGHPYVKEVIYVAPGPKPGKAGGGRKISYKSALNGRAFMPESAQHQLLGIQQMQQLGFTGEGKLIAVLDAGFPAVDQLPYFQHLFSQNLLLGKHDFTKNDPEVFNASSHGTKSLSTIAAIDSAVFIGSAPLAHFLLAITEDVSSEYVIEEYNWLMAAEWADSAGADIITASLGYNTFDDPAMSYTYEDMDGTTTVSAIAANFATQRGMLVVTSAGNSGNDSWHHIVTPADALDILSVGAVTATEEVASFSSRGPTADGRIKPEVSALGVQVTVSETAGGFTKGNGTSFAAPQIAGLAAAVWQAFPELSNIELKEALMEAGSFAEEPNNDIGSGIPHFQRIRRIVLGVEEEETHNNLLVYPNPVYKGQLFIKPAMAGEPVYAALYTVAGVEIGARQKLEAVPAQGPLYRLSVEELKKGLYFLHLFQGDTHFVHKILKY